ncbi:MAG: hypothetical protein GXO35_02740 [Gammaproteobacteria bacterium]|nr:hypothetical protein [Gammaproteobacteria bacterium]
MTDSSTDSQAAEDEPVLTKLLSSGDSPEVETWQLSGFRSDQPKVSLKRASEEVVAVEQATSSALKQQAELLKKEAFDQAHKEGYEAGLAKGVEAGREEARLAALEELRAEFSPKLSQFDQILSLLSDPYHKLEQQVLSELVDLSLHAAEKVIKQAVLHNSDWLLEAVVEAVKVLPDEVNSVQVQLHPEDLDTLALIESPLAVEWALKPNSDIVPGTCLVSYQNSSVINSWIDRFEEVSASLKERLLSAEHQAKSDAQPISSRNDQQEG